MRILILAICLVASLSSYAQESWERLNPKPTGNAGMDIVFLDNQKGFIVNAEEIIKTDDGGTTWKVLKNISSGKRIRFSGQTGFIIGDQGAIYKSADKGETWSSLPTPFTDYLNAITVISKDTLRITGDNKLHLSNDGGATWTSRSIPGVNVEDSHFTSALVGHVACINGTILKTIDGGQNWYATATSNSIPSDFFRIVFVDEKLGYASREHRNLYKTEDGGETWAKVNDLADAAYTIQFLDEKVGFIAGDHGAMHKTRDGGRTWEWMGFAGRIDGNDLYSLFFLDENRGYATGMRGRILRTMDGGQSWEQYSQLYYTIEGIQFTSDQNGYLETGNYYYRTHDGGVNWEQVASPGHYEFANGFQFVSDEVGYSIGGGSTSAAGSVFKTSNGGASWERLDILVDEGLSSTFFLDENTGFVSGGFNQRKTLKTSDGGSTWKQVSNINFGSIQFVNNQTGYANRRGYAFGQLYKSSDGGENWEMIFEDERRVIAFHFVSDTVGYLVGDNALTYKTTDGGLAWKKLEIPYEYFRDVEFYNNYLGYILSENGHLYRTRDGGINWESLYQLRGLNSVKLKGEDLYISGENGAILRSSIDLSALTEFSPWSLLNLTDSTAIVSAVAKSSFDKKDLRIELGRESGQYEQRSELGSFETYSTGLRHTFEKLEPDTKYFCRLVVSAAGMTWNSKEFSFTTESSLITGIEDRAEQIAFVLYPNPVSNSLRIERTESHFLSDYTILSLDGRTMLHAEIPVHGEIDVSMLRDGVYLLRLTKVDGGSLTRRFLKR